jgi:TonB family protein
MKRIFLSAAMILGAVSLQAQMFLDTVWFDIHWKQAQQEKAKYYRLVYADTSGEVRFIIRDFFISGKPQMEGTYKSINPDVRDGHFVFYYENGNRMSEMNYRANQVSGEAKEWYANGNPKSEAVYENQRLNGTYRTWREDGTKSMEVNYKSGELNGLFISFYPNGKKVREDFYSNGDLKRKRCFNQEGKDTAWFPYLELPEFPGGTDKFSEFIENNLIYPADALRRKLQGRVDVEVSISRDGKVLKAVIARTDREVFNEEALRLINSSPLWKPGKKDGQLVEITITVPVWFRIKPPADVQ